MDAGDFVPDEVTNAMVDDRLDQPDAADGFLLDGYPRTVEQVADLDEMLADAGQPLDAVVELTVDPTRSSPGCSSAPPSRAAPTTPRTSSAAGWRCTPRRPSRWPASTPTTACCCQVDGVGEIDEVTARSRPRPDPAAQPRWAERASSSRPRALQPMRVRVSWWAAPWRARRARRPRVRTARAQRCRA